MLKRIPNEKDLSRIYFELSKLGARCVGNHYQWPYKEMDKSSLLVLAAEMSRYDPRLFGVLVEFFIKNWREINLAKLRQKYNLMNTPQVFGVIAAFLKSTLDGDEINFYARYMCMGLNPVPTQFFYHGIYSVGGALAARAYESGLLEYKEWGFLACERPVTATKALLGTLDKVSRINILRKLLDKKKIIKISDYLKVLNQSVSRQQALIDLKGCDFARKIGKGRGVRWKLVV